MTNKESGSETNLMKIPSTLEGAAQNKNKETEENDTRYDHCDRYNLKNIILSSKVQCLGIFSSTSIENILIEHSYILRKFS